MIIKEFCLGDVRRIAKFNLFLNFILSNLYENKVIYLILESEKDYEILEIIKEISEKQNKEFRLKITIEDLK